MRDGHICGKPVTGHSFNEHTETIVHRLEVRSMILCQICGKPAKGHSLHDHTEMLVKTLRRRSPRSLPPRFYTDSRCGTETGYKRHIRQGSAACLACKNAHREYNRKNYRRRGA